MADKKRAPTFEKSQLCKACGVPLVFAKSEDTGQTIPLDVRNLPTYMLVIHDGVAVAKRSPAYVDHGALCPKREDKGESDVEARQEGKGR